MDTNFTSSFSSSLSPFCQHFCSRPRRFRIPSKRGGSLYPSFLVPFSHHAFRSESSLVADATPLSLRSVLLSGAFTSSTTSDSCASRRQEDRVFLSECGGSCASRRQEDRVLLSECGCSTLALDSGEDCALWPSGCGGSCASRQQEDRVLLSECGDVRTLLPPSLVHLLHDSMVGVVPAWVTTQVPKVRQLTREARDAGGSKDEVRWW